MNLKHRLAAILCLCFLATVAQAKPGPLVYVECTNPNYNADATSEELKANPTISMRNSFGSGVVINSEGFVLTAAHVTPKGWDCFASADTKQRRQQIELKEQERLDPELDAAIWKFSDERTYDFLGYCELSDEIIGRLVYPAGFPKETTTNKPSFRVGIIGDVSYGSDGVIGTDAQTIRGMSGGPLLTQARTDASGFLGIVAGMRKDRGTLEIDQWQVIAAERIAQKAPQLQLAEDCYPTPRKTEVFGQGWDVRQPKLDSRVTPAEGFCYIVGVTGSFPHDENRLFIEVDAATGTYVLKGDNPSSGTYGGLMQCQYY